MLEIKTLGGLRLISDGKVISNILPQKAQALIVYLAFHDQSISREVLAELFWEGNSQTRAMNSIRGVLSNIRKNIPDYLDIKRKSVGFLPKSNIWFDVAEFRAAIDDNAIIDTLNIYKGDFLQGFYLRQCLKFDHWIVNKQEILRQEMINILQNEVRKSIINGDYFAGLTYGQRLIEMNPLMESTHRQLMVIFAYLDQREGALAQYKTCQHILKSELDVVPNNETKKLFETIRDGKIIVPKKPTVPVHNLPEQVTPFIGRSKEIFQLENLIRDPNVRIISLVGPGGIGKSRLVQEVSLKNMFNFANGVFFISLASISRFSEIISSIANEIKFPFQVKGNLENELLSYLSSKEILFIFDNCEHLKESMDFLNQIVKFSPKIKIFTTSRIVLKIPGEYVLHLGGLTVPDKDQDENLIQFDAVELFISTAKRINIEFQINSENQSDIGRICKLSNGMPLALILSASWINTLDISDIAKNLSQGISLLNSDAKEISTRHHSLRSVIDYSWSLLSERERILMQEISVFRSGFTAEASNTIFDCSPSDLKGLINKGFIHHEGSGRFQVHEFTRQYCFVKLAENPDLELRNRTKCSSYYMDLLVDWEIDSVGPRQAKSLRLLEKEIDNVRSAWRWALEEDLIEQIDSGLNGYCQFFIWKEDFEEGYSICKSVIDRFAVENSKIERKLISRALNWQSRFQDRLGQYDVSVESGVKAWKIINVDLFSREEIDNEKASVLKTLGSQVHFAEIPEYLELLGAPVELLEKSLSISTTLNNRWETADVLRLISDHASRYDENYAKAKNTIEKSLKIFRELDDTHSVALCLARLGNQHRLIGQLDKAEELYRESVTLFRNVGSRFHGYGGQEGLAFNHIWTGKFEEGNLLLDGCIAYYSDISSKPAKSTAVTWKSMCLIGLGRFSEAQQGIDDILDYQKSNEPNMYYLSLLLLGQIKLGEKEFSKAEEYFVNGLDVLYNHESALDRSLLLTNLGLAEIELGKQQKAIKHIAQAIEIALINGAVYTKIFSLPIAARLFANQGEIEYAIEIFELANSYSHVSNSRWVKTAIGNYFDNLYSDLPKKKIKHLKSLGKSREIEKTLAELSAKLEILVEK